MYMYRITPLVRVCSESSDSDKYVMLFCLPSSGFIFMPALPALNVLSSISAVDDYIINVDKVTLTGQSM